MLEVLLDAALRARGTEGHVHSAGTRADGRPPVTEVVDVLDARGFDVRDHLSRPLDADLVAGADLVLPLAREHLREAVVARPDAFARTFTPKELVRRAGASGGRRPDEELPAFLARLHEGRSAQELMGDEPADDVADPIGGPRSGFERTAVELTELAGAIAAILVPVRDPDAVTLSAHPSPQES